MSCKHCADWPLTQRTLSEFSAGSGCIIEVELFTKDFVIGYFESYDKIYGILSLRSDSTNDKKASIPLSMSNVKVIKNLCCEEMYEN